MTMFNVQSWVNVAQSYSTTRHTIILPCTVCCMRCRDGRGNYYCNNCSNVCPVHSMCDRVKWRHQAPKYLGHSSDKQVTWHLSRTQ